MYRVLTLPVQRKQETMLWLALPAGCRAWAHVGEVPVQAAVFQAAWLGLAEAVCVTAAHLFTSKLMFAHCRFVMAFGSR